ncbi:MAG: hypothetical protein QM483_12545 [Desulfuromusa sp.]
MRPYTFGCNESDPHLTGLAFWWQKMFLMLEFPFLQQKRQGGTDMLAEEIESGALKLSVVNRIRLVDDFA